MKTLAQCQFAVHSLGFPGSTTVMPLNRASTLRKSDDAVDIAPVIVQHFGQLPLNIAMADFR